MNKEIEKIWLLYENSKNWPKFLYHATYKELLPKIEKYGLVPGLNKFWEDSDESVVYLADDPNVAFSYAETSDIVDEEWLDEIIILQIDTKNLKMQNLNIDKNNLNGDTYEYNGSIPPQYLKLINL